MTYPIQPESLFWAAQIGETGKRPLWLNNSVQSRRLIDCSSISAAAWTQRGKQSHLWTPCVYFSDQGFPVEYELDKFNTPHTGTTLRHPQNWLCRLRCNIPLRHLATSPRGNIFWRHSRFSPKQPEAQTHGDFNVSLLKQQTRLLLHYGEHISLARPTTLQLSPLHNYFISFPYFFPSYETCSINVNSLFHAAIKNLHIKANGIFVFFILLYFTTTLSDGITHTRKNTFLRQK